MTCTCMSYIVKVLSHKIVNIYNTLVLFVCIVMTCTYMSYSQRSQDC